MDRLRRLAEFWGWLPAFRAAAETGHLPTASRLIRVSPSALSRSVRLLEKNLGERLFDREGRSLRINAAGERFLGAVRDAMRLVDEGLAAATSRQVEGPLRLSIPPLFIHAVMPAILALKSTHPGIVPALTIRAATEVNGLLLRGQIDAAFVAAPVDHTRLRISAAGSVALGIYCGRMHPLFRSRRPRPQEILCKPFVVLDPGDGDPVADGWPPALGRQVGLRVADLDTAHEMCAGGTLLALLPRAVADARSAGKLKLLPLPEIPPLTFYAVRRESIVRGGVVEAFLDEVLPRGDAPEPS